ncbi:unnamed protein product [Cladocopium goreaui]|uniref:Uncharacterized protein n=1 Tax=Cladocopium goreaui TaxID=2562237 RepID=A0A9P1G0E7_9DINO|nr:unnamed protein product [Cladocopium goreaui]
MIWVESQLVIMRHGQKWSLPRCWGLETAEKRDGLGELRLHFSEWVSKARAKMLVAGLEILRPSRRLQEEGFYSVQHYEVNLTKPGTMFMEAGGKSAVLQIHQQLLAAGCGEIESKCQAVLEMPEGAFLDRNRTTQESIQKPLPTAGRHQPIGRQRRFKTTACPTESASGGPERRCQLRLPFLGPEPGRAPGSHGAQRCDSAKSGGALAGPDRRR